MSYMGVAETSVARSRKLGRTLSPIQAILPSTSVCSDSAKNGLSSDGHTVRIKTSEHCRRIPRNGTLLHHLGIEGAVYKGVTSSRLMDRDTGCVEGSCLVSASFFVRK